MGRTPEVQEIPDDWSPEDIVNFINLTLNSPDVSSIEIFKQNAKHFFRIHFEN